MNLRNLRPMDLAVDIAQRSDCAVRMGAVLTDRKGRIFSWGWNNSGRDGMGQHAEASAIARANPRRLKGSSIYVYGTRKRTGRSVTSEPCGKCMEKIRAAGVETIFYFHNGQIVRKYA